MKKQGKNRRQGKRKNGHAPGFEKRVKNRPCKFGKYLIDLLIFVMEDPVKVKYLIDGREG